MKKQVGSGPTVPSDRLTVSKPSCLIVASASTEGVSAQSFLQAFNQCSTAFNLQVATPGECLFSYVENGLFHHGLFHPPHRMEVNVMSSAVGKPIDFVDVNQDTSRWVQDYQLKAYASPAKLESIDGARYHAVLIPSCPGAMTDLANSGSLARILHHFRTEKKPMCAIGHGVAALCCATEENKSWLFQGYSLTGPSVYELVRKPDFSSLPVIVEDFVKDSGATFSSSEPDAVHVILDRHLVTGQNDNSTLLAVQSLILLCNTRK